MATDMTSHPLRSTLFLFPPLSCFVCSLCQQARQLNNRIKSVMLDDAKANLSLHSRTNQCFQFTCGHVCLRLPCTLATHFIKQCFWTVSCASVLHCACSMTLLMFSRVMDVWSISPKQKGLNVDSIKRTKLHQGGWVFEMRLEFKYA